MLEPDWFLTAHIYSLILIVTPNLSYLTCPITRSLQSERTNENQVLNATS